MTKLEIEILPQAFGLYRLPPATPFPEAVRERPFVWIARTESELSVVCEEGLLDEAVLERSEVGWRALRVAGPLDFALVGILAELGALLAATEIPIIALSSYDTDTILVKEAALPRATSVLEAGGHRIFGG